MRSNTPWTPTTGGTRSPQTAGTRSTGGSSSPATGTPRHQDSETSSRISVPTILVVRMAAMVLVIGAMVAAVVVGAAPGPQSDNGTPAPVQWREVGCR
ncbi:hypothetical protein SEA_DOGGS_49 [Gordonia phage Doggs]|nr:hypothetical protein SEA_DOGGS_49 [Gordonia phage Doggs]